MKKINFFQDNINYDDIMSYGDNSYEDNYDEIILNDDIFIDADEKFNEDREYIIKQDKSQLLESFRFYRNRLSRHIVRQN